MDAIEERQAQLVAADKAQRIRDALEDLHTAEVLHSTEGGLSPLPPPEDPTGVSIPPAQQFNADRRKQ
jgi:hypothetical protein